MKKQMKTLLSCLVCLLLIISAFILTVPAEDASSTDVWDGTIAEGFASKATGKEGDPIIITTGKELAYLAEEVNCGELYEEVYFKLGNDINLNGHPFEPIGGKDSNYYFKGNFNGNGHIVSGLNITKDSAKGYASIGFFGRTHDAVIRNLTLEGNIDVDVKANLGSVVGQLRGSELYNCVSRVSVTGTADANSGTTIYAGGLVGLAENQSKVYCNSVSGNTSLSARSDVTVCVAGIVGRTGNETDITDCMNTGTVTAGTGKNIMMGGVVAAANVFQGVEYAANLKNCINTGNICLAEGATAAGKKYVGGIAAYVSQISALQGCHHTGELPEADIIGGIAGYDNKAENTYTDCSTSYAVAGSTDAKGVWTNCATEISVIDNYITEFNNAVKASVDADALATKNAEDAFVPETDNQESSTTDNNNTSETDENTSHTDKNTSEPETEKLTEKAENSNSAQSTDSSSSDKGCGSSLSTAGVALLIIASVAVFGLRKKEI